MAGNFLTAVTTSFSPNTKAKSAEVNTNFSDVVTALNAGTRDLYVGNVWMKTSAKSADYTVTDTDAISTILMTTSNTSRTVTLPTAADNTGRILTVKKVDSGTGICTVDGEGAEAIDGATTFVLISISDFVELHCDGIGWHVISKNVGLKIYAHGTTYNGGNAPTITLTGGGGSLSTVFLGDFMPYQTADGTWRCRFNINVQLSSAARTTAALAVAGWTFANVNDGQAIEVTTFGTVAITGGYAQSTGGTFQIAHASATTTQYALSGDVKLASKPTWAY